MYNSEKNLILALETGIDGGSVAILRAEKVLCRAEGVGNVSKSEDLLMLIEALLAKNSLHRREIGKVAFSDAPGSLTGIRIGAATAFGLGDSLDAEVLKVPVLEAVLASSTTTERRAVSAIFTGKGVFYCRYRKSGVLWSNETQIMSERDPQAFLKMMEQAEEYFVVHINQELNSHMFGQKVQIRQGSLAELIGRAATQNRV